MSGKKDSLIKRNLLKIMCLDVLAFIGITVVSIVLVAIPILGLLWYVSLPYEWSHGYIFMTVKWGFASAVFLGIVGFVLHLIFEWIDNAKMRARK